MRRNPILPQGLGAFPVQSPRTLPIAETRPALHTDSGYVGAVDLDQHALRSKTPDDGVDACKNQINDDDLSESYPSVAGPAEVDASICPKRASA